jgi:hypothetical protein
MGCPFKVGDRIVQRNSFAPIAVVTEVCDDKFVYVYEEVWHAHPRMGISYSGGEVYPNGFKYYSLYDDNSKSEPPFLHCTGG